MKQRDIDYAVIFNTINILSVMCAADNNMIIDTLTGILWDEEEANSIKNSIGKFEHNLSHHIEKSRTKF